MPKREALLPRFEGRRPDARIDVKDVSGAKRSISRGPGGEPRTAVVPAPGSEDTWSDPSWDPRRLEVVAQQREEMVREGLPSEQRRRALGPLGVRKAISERVYKTVSPLGYGMALTRLGEVLKSETAAREDAGPEREDAFRLYLGLPQRFDTLEVSPFTPPSSTNPDAVYYRLKGGARAHAKLVNRFLRFERARLDSEQGPRRGGASEQSTVQNGYFPDTLFDFSLFGTFLVARGSDQLGEFVSYYDFWDMDVPLGNVDVHALAARMPQPIRRRLLKDEGNPPETGPGSKPADPSQDNRPLTTVPLELVAGSPIEFYDRIHFDRPRMERIIALEDQLLSRKSSADASAEARIPDVLSSYLRSAPYGLGFEHSLALAFEWAEGQPDPEVASILSELKGLYALNGGATITDV